MTDEVDEPEDVGRPDPPAESTEEELAAADAIRVEQEEKDAQAKAQQIAFRNMSRVRSATTMTVVVTVEVRGDGLGPDAPMREAITIWTLAGKKIGDVDKTTFADLFEMEMPT